MKNKILLKQDNNFVFLKHCMLCVLLVFMGLVSCQKNEPISPKDSVVTPVSYAPIQIQDMGYTSASELQSLYDNNPTEVIHFNVARLIAETELLAGANFALAPTIDPNEEWYLTPLPKVVYNYNNTPKYYEFGYVYHGQIVATITTYAQKEIDGVIAYIFDDPLDYSCPDLDFYVGKYPNRYYGQNGVCYLKNCDELLDQIQIDGFGLYKPTEALDREFVLSIMPQEDLDAIEADMAAEGTNFEDFIVRRDEYWASIDEFFELYLHHLLQPDVIDYEPEALLLDDFINGNLDEYSDNHPNIVNHLSGLLNYAIGFYDTGILDEYSDPHLQMTRWTNFCGPAACAWVYRGKYDNYNGDYLPILGDGTRDLFYESVIYTYFDVIRFAYYYYYNSQLSSGLSAARSAFDSISAIADYGLGKCFYDETVPFLWGEWLFPLYHGGLNRGFRTATNNQYQVQLTAEPYEWISLNHEPIIIEINCNHYIVAFGYGVTHDINGYVKDKYFKVVDNGSTTLSNYYRPYMRRENWWNLHYGLKHI